MLQSSAATVASGPEGDHDSEHVDEGGQNE